MNEKMRELIEKVAPFFIIGIGIAMAVALLVIFSYILIWGLLIGSVLGLIAWIKTRFFPAPSQNRTPHEGRIIEHDDD